LAGLAQGTGRGRGYWHAVQAGDQPPPYLGVADLGEQARGEQQVDHDPGRQNPNPMLQPSGTGEGVIDHLERD
jgi:hypothetical protein